MGSRVGKGVSSDTLSSAAQVDVMKEAYHQGVENEEEELIGDSIRSKDVGHNIYILAHQVRVNA